MTYNEPSEEKSRRGYLDKKTSAVKGFFDKQQDSQSPTPRRSCLSQFFRSKLNILLLTILISLAIVFACVLALVAIPAHNGHNHEDPAHYAVIKENFPDPALTWDWGRDSGWYAFATRGNGTNIQVATAKDRSFSNWTYLQGHDALPTPGKWAATKINDTQVWAPSVMSLVHTTDYVMFYSALAKDQTRKHCIGSATSNNIIGPYTALDEPIVCDFEHGGVIDPAYFHDFQTNTSYLVYKRDGNAIGVGGACSNGGSWPNTPTPLMAVALDANNLAMPASEPFVLLMNTEADGANIEAPMLWMWEYEISEEQQKQYNSSVLTTYHLAYNSGCYAHSDYRINHIICTPAPPTGIKDCTWNQILADDSSNSSKHIYAKNLLRTGDTEAKLLSPGGAAIGASSQGGLGDGNFYKMYMAFHADTNPNWFDGPHNKTRVRSMFIAELEYNMTEPGLVSVKRLVEPGESGSEDDSDYVPK